MCLDYEDNEYNGQDLKIYIYFFVKKKSKVRFAYEYAGQYFNISKIQNQDLKIVFKFKHLRLMIGL